MLSFRALMLIVLLGVFPFFAQAQFVFVGNGGEGVQEGPHLFTRDLYEYDLHTSPYFGPFRDPRILRLLTAGAPLLLNDSQSDLLVRKLTDLEYMIPGLGQGLLKVLQFYHWRFVPHDLALSPDHVRSEIPEDRRVAIANRYMASIIVNETAFQSLDDGNKIALLLHEAVYALLPIRRQKGNLGEQDVGMARLLTAELFTKDRLQSAELRELVADQLGFLFLPANRNGALSLTVDPAERVLRLEERAGGSGVDITESTVTAEVLKQKVADFCAGLFTENSAMTEVRVSRTPFFQIENIIYTNLNGTAQYKLHFDFARVSQPPFVVTPQDCRTKTQEKIDFLFSPVAVDFQRGLFSFDGAYFHGMNDFYCLYENERHVSRVWGSAWEKQMTDISMLPTQMAFAGVCGAYQGVHNIDGILAYTFKRGYSCWFKNWAQARRVAGVKYPELLIKKSAADVPFFFKANQDNLCRY